MEYKGYIIDELSEMFCKLNHLVYPTFLVKSLDGDWINDCESLEEAQRFIDNLS